MKKQKSESPEEKRNRLHTVVFLVAVGIAVVCLLFGVVKLGRKDAGFETVTATLEENERIAAADIQFVYCFDGSSGEIKATMKALGAAYSPALLRVYRLLDADTEYEGINNIAALNAHIGEELSVSEELYRVLLEAQALTREEKGYNVFGGALSRAWEQIRILEEPEGFDPLRDETQRERLERLREASGDLTNFSLTVVDEATRTVRLEVSESYLALLRELEQGGPILDLGLLHDAFELRLLGEAMEAQGYRNGFFSMQSGAVLVLPDCSGLTLCLYGRAEGEVSPAATLPGEGGAGVSQMRAFADREEEPDYYEIDGLLRHPWLPASGEYRNLLLSALVMAEDPVRAAYLCVQMQECASAEELEALATANGATVAWILNDGTQTVHANSEVFTAREDYGWEIMRNEE